jgi:4-amino-4-deoxy-L-arabinose transferase-like glycosyltransferase
MIRFLSTFPRRALTIAFIAGLAIRLIILANTGGLTTKIADEQHYRQIAQNIIAGHGFAWGERQPTSIRPPLYPALLAGVWTLSPHNLQAVRVLQIMLSLATAFLVYTLGSRVYGPAVGAWAAAVCWLYPSLIFFNFLILTETLFTFLLVAFALLAVLLVQTPRAVFALACGIALGLGALTRSILWPLPVILCPLLAVLIRAPLARRLTLPCLVLAGYALVVAPWAIRNTRLQGVVTIVDTMGGINLRMGNYEYTPDDRMWDAVMLTGAQNWIHGYQPSYPGEPVTEGTKEKWAQHKAFEYMREHRMETLRRSLIKFADFWGLEREFVAGVQQGIYTPPLWFTVLGTLAILAGYVFVVTAAAAGIWLAAPRDGRSHVVMLLPVLVIVAGHTLAFGHSRYHLPLVPILAIYGAAFVTARVPSITFTSRARALGAMVTVSALLAIWIRQVALVDLPRIKALLDHVG